MKRYRVFYVGTLAALAGLCFFGLAYGFRHYAAPEARIHHFTQEVSQELNLDERQRQVLLEIAAATSERYRELHDGHERICHGAIALVGQERIIKEDILDLISEHRQKFDDMTIFAAEQFARFHEMLSAEQRNQLAQIIENHAYHKF